MPSERQSKDAGYIDVADFGEKPIQGAYGPGDAFIEVDGRKVDISDIDDVLGTPVDEEEPAGPTPAR